MKKTNGKSRSAHRGRPRSAARTDLVVALIGRQDAIARHRQRQIDAIRTTHVLVADVLRTQAADLAIVRARFADAAAAMAPQIAAEPDPGAVFRLLDAGLREALRDVADQIEAAARSGADRAAYRPPRLAPSRDLPSARARAARLATELSDLRALIAR